MDGVGVVLLKATRALSISSGAHLPSTFEREAGVVIPVPDEAAVAQRGLEAAPRSHSREVGKPGQDWKLLTPFFFFKD